MSEQSFFLFFKPSRLIIDCLSRMCRDGIVAQVTEQQPLTLKPKKTPAICTITNKGPCGIVVLIQMRDVVSRHGYEIPLNKTLAFNQRMIRKLQKKFCSRLVVCVEEPSHSTPCFTDPPLYINPSDFTQCNGITIISDQTGKRQNS